MCMLFAFFCALTVPGTRLNMVLHRKMLCLSKRFSLDSTYWYEVAPTKEKVNGVCSVCSGRGKSVGKSQMKKKKKKKRRCRWQKELVTGPETDFAKSLLATPFADYKPPKPPRTSIAPTARSRAQTPTRKPAASTHVWKVDLTSLETSHQAFED